MRIRFCLLVLFSSLVTISCSILSPRHRPAHVFLKSLCQDKSEDLDAKTVVQNSINSTVWLEVTENVYHGFKRVLNNRYFGTGVIIDSQAGLIMTAAHVVSGKTDIKVSTLRINDKGEVKSARRHIRADILVVDELNDVAIIMVSRKYDLPPAIPIHCGESFNFGQPVAQFGKSSKVEFGRIMKEEVRVNKKKGRHNISFRLSIIARDGDSGAPLVDLKTGQLIGIMTTTDMLKPIAFATSIYSVIDILHGTAVSD